MLRSTTKSFLCLAISTITLLSARAGGAETAALEKPGYYLGRQIAPTMHFSGASWLTRQTREREERPEELYQSLTIGRGQSVCDFGCGNGYHTLQLAKRVGPRGTVYAVDIQPEMLKKLAARAKARGYENIKRVRAREDDPQLPADALDLVLMVDVYHELADPAGVLAKVRESMHRDGRLVLVEFREEDPEVPIRPLHKMSKTQVQKEITQSGFKLTEQYDELPWQHVMIYSRDDAAAAEVPLKPWVLPAR